MIFSRDYIGYLARRTVKHLIDAKMITTSDLKVTEARVTGGLTAVSYTHLDVYKRQAAVRSSRIFALSSSVRTAVNLDSSA